VRDTPGYERNLTPPLPNTDEYHAGIADQQTSTRSAQPRPEWELCPVR